MPFIKHFDDSIRGLTSAANAYKKDREAVLKEVRTGEERIHKMGVQLESNKKLLIRLHEKLSDQNKELEKTAKLIEHENTCIQVALGHPLTSLKPFQSFCLQKS